MRREIPKNETELVKEFESIGDNCEFGLIQRFAGAEPLGLFRFNFTRVESLIAGLETNFQGLGEPGRVTAEWRNEWFIREATYKFAYHTFNSNPTLDVLRLVSDNESYLRFLADDFLEGVAEGRRIYVRKDGPDVTLAQIRQVAQLLRQRGPAVLLWVTLADADHPPGTVEWVDDGLMQARTERFAPYAEAMKADPVLWLPILRKAWSLNYLSDLHGLATPTARQSLCSENFGGWTGTEFATSEFCWEKQPPQANLQLMKHTLVKPCSLTETVFGCLIRTGLTPHTHYVASVYVFLPEAFPGSAVGLVFLGCTTLFSRKADLELTGQWQHIWVCAKLNDSAIAYPRINITGAEGTHVYTAGWRVELGHIPSAYL